MWHGWLVQPWEMWRALRHGRRGDRATFAKRLYKE